MCESTQPDRPRGASPPVATDPADDEPCDAAELEIGALEATLPPVPGKGGELAAPRTPSPPPTEPTKPGDDS